MRVPSVYKVYQRYFGYPEADSPARRKAFGAAIAETLPVISATFVDGSFSAIEEYENGRYPRTLALGFLRKFKTLVQSRKHGDPLHDWDHRSAELSLGADLFPGSTRRGLQIDFPYLYNASDNEIVIPIFGPSRNMPGEVGVLRTLFEEGTMTPELPKDLEVVTYWDLVNGAEESVRLDVVVAADRHRVLSACRSLLDNPR